MEIEFLRMAERIVVVIGGIASIYFGYKLFTLSNLSNSPNDSSATFSWREIANIGLNRIGPGIFFALFGAGILYSSVNTQIVITSTQNRPIETAVKDQGSATPRYTYKKIAADTGDQEKRVDALSALSGMKKDLEEDAEIKKNGQIISIIRKIFDKWWVMAGGV